MLKRKSSFLVLNSKITLLILVGLIYHSNIFAQSKDWDLSELAKSEAQWSKELKQTVKAAEKIKSYSGKLGNSSKTLEEALNLSSTSLKNISRICSWSGLQLATDMMSSKNASNSQKCAQQSNLLVEATSYIQPEIIKIGKAKIDVFLKENKNLEPYSQMIREYFDSEAHTLSASEESLITNLSPMLGKSSETYNLLLNTEVKWPSTELSSGLKEIDTTEYYKQRVSKNRDDRKKAFEAYYKGLAQIERTAGSTLAQSVMTRNSLAKIRKYKNALDARLSSENLPEEVYRTLVKEVNNSLPTLHRYLKLRGKMLGLKTQSYYDAYPIATHAPKTFPLKETQELTIKAVEPLGKDYVQKLTNASSKNWMSVYPAKGKKSGAFMSGGAYDVHPYVFLNHIDDYNSASTYAHEWGHALHSIYSNENQPYPKAGYSLYIAEIAAITNEVLLNDYAIKTSKTDAEKLYYINEALESIRTTYFRQTQFAEFELAIHEEAEKTGSLTGQRISEIFGDIQRRYHGHNKNVMKIDPEYFKEWIFVGHFYAGFYVYNYATSMAGAYYFGDKILNKDSKAVEQYINVLKAGGSKYPQEILKDANLDLSTKDPYKFIDKRANQLMDQMEDILKRQAKQKDRT